MPGLPRVPRVLSGWIRDPEDSEGLGTCSPRERQHRQTSGAIPEDYR